MKTQTLQDNFPNINFTPQELVILKLASTGFSNKEIGSKLFIEENTAKRHRQNIMRKVGIKGKSEMMKLLLTLEI
jgi:DNA-binding NarL/FixJ family response regulator